MSARWFDYGLGPDGRAMSAPRALCLPPGQRVLTADGYRPVAEVDARDAVETGAGRLRLVTGVFRREVGEPLVRVRTAGVHVLRATGGHPVLSRRQEGPAQWLYAAELRVGDLVAVRPGGGAAVARLRPAVPLPTGGRGEWPPRTGGLAILAREERRPYWPTNWTAVTAVDCAPYVGAVYDLEVEEDHSYLTDGVVVADCSGFWS